jgi:hypothetical protein
MLMVVTVPQEKKLQISILIILIKSIPKTYKLLQASKYLCSS